MLTLVHSQTHKTAGTQQDKNDITVWHQCTTGDFLAGILLRILFCNPSDRSLVTRIVCRWSCIRDRVA